MKKTAAQLANRILVKIARNVDPERAAQSENNAPARSPRYYGENPGAAVHSEQNLTARQRGQNLYPTPPTQPQQDVAQRIIAAGGASGRGYNSRLTQRDGKETYSRTDFDTQKGTLGKAQANTPAAPQQQAAKPAAPSAQQGTLGKAQTSKPAKVEIGNFSTKNPYNSNPQAAGIAAGMIPGMGALGRTQPAQPGRGNLAEQGFSVQLPGDAAKKPHRGGGGHKPPAQAKPGDGALAKGTAQTNPGAGAIGKSKTSPQPTPSAGNYQQGQGPLQAYQNTGGGYQQFQNKGPQLAYQSSQPKTPGIFGTAGTLANNNNVKNSKPQSTVQTAGDYAKRGINYVGQAAKDTWNSPTGPKGPGRFVAEHYARATIPQYPGSPQQDQGMREMQGPDYDKPITERMTNWYK